MSTGDLNAQPNEEQGSALPRYRTIAEIGRGGMATVSLAYLRGPFGFTKLHVVKQLKPWLADDPEVVQMFVEEARLSARLNHPNLAHTNEAGFDGKHHFMVMEYIDGPSLASLLRRSRSQAPLPLDLHVRVLCEVLAGAHYAHDLLDFDGSPMQVVHRDISPQNVIVSYDGFVKLIDFGIAKSAGSTARTRTGLLKGKVPYMAPEQFTGKADRRADVYAVGVLLWEALSEAPLWGDLSDDAIAAEVVEAGLPAPRCMNPNVSPELDEVCRRALARDPEERYATAAEFRTALEACLEPPGAFPARLGDHVATLFAQDREERKRRIEREIQSEERGSPALPESLAGASTTLAPLAGESEAGGLTRELAARFGFARHARIVLGASAAVVFAAGAITVRARSSTPAPVAEQIVEQVATSAWPPDVRAAAVQLERKPRTIAIDVLPAGARLFLDGVPLPSNPIVALLSDDPPVHVLRAEAPGHVTQQEWIDAQGPKAAWKLQLKRQDPRPVLSAHGVAGQPYSVSSPSALPNGVPDAAATLSTSAPVRDAVPDRPRSPKRVLLDPEDPWASSSGAAHPASSHPPMSKPGVGTLR